MLLNMKNKNWDEFWGEFLQVRFHQGNPELWPSRQRKADWCKKYFDLKTGAKILDLGCGDGLIDIWLSRMGYEVTAVDKNKTVLNLAKLSDDTKKTEFICSDLKEVKFDNQFFDAILLIETLGLMSMFEDKKLLQKCHGWLKPGGKLIIDCPEVVEINNSWIKEFPDGIVSGKSSFDTTTRIQNIQFTFKPHSEKEFGLMDSTNESNKEKPGINRYLYPKTELVTILKDIGFLQIQEIEHYYPKNYFSLLAGKQITANQSA